LYPASAKPSVSGFALERKKEIADVKLSRRFQ
jgi:hypothetical protein